MTEPDYLKVIRQLAEQTIREFEQRRQDEAVKLNLTPQDYRFLKSIRVATSA